MKTSSGTKRIWAMSPGVRKLSAPITMPETGLPPPVDRVLMHAVAGEMQDAPAVLVQASMIGVAVWSMQSSTS
jgi:hypothetical protein